MAIDVLVPVKLQALQLMKLDIMAPDNQVAYGVIYSVLAGRGFVAHESSLSGIGVQLDDIVHVALVRRLGIQRPLSDDS